MRDLGSLTCAMKLLLLLAVSESSAQTITGFAGRSVTLPCSYNAKYYGPLPACWGRGAVPLRGCNNRVIDTNGRIVTFRRSGRYLLEGEFSQGDVSLTILNAVESDSGTYGCRVDIPGLFNDQKRNVFLIIQKAPPTTTQAPITSTALTEPLTSTGPPTTTQAPITSTALTEPQTSTGPPTTTQAPITSTALTEPQTSTAPPTTPWAPIWSTWPTDPQTTRTLTSTAMDTHAPPTTTQAPITSTALTEPQTSTAPPTTTQAPITSTALTEPLTSTGHPTTTQAPITSTALTEPLTSTGPPTTPWAPMWSTWPTDPQTTRTLTSTAMDTHEPPKTHPGTSSRLTDPQTTRALTTTATDTRASRRPSHAAAPSPASSLRRSMKEDTEMQTIADTERKELKHPDVLSLSLWILVPGLTFLLGTAGLILWCKQRKTGRLSIPSLIVQSAEDCETLNTSCSHETSHIVMQDMETIGKASDPMLLP